MGDGRQKNDLGFLLGSQEVIDQEMSHQKSSQVVCLKMKLMAVFRFFPRNVFLPPHNFLDDLVLAINLFSFELPIKHFTYLRKVNNLI